MIRLDFAGASRGTCGIVNGAFVHPTRHRDRSRLVASKRQAVAWVVGCGLAVWLAMAIYLG